MGKKEVYSKKCREKVKIKYKWRLFFTNMTLPDNLSPENQQLSPQISQTLFWAWDKGAGLTSAANHIQKLFEPPCTVRLGH